MLVHPLVKCEHFMNQKDNMKYTAIFGQKEKKKKDIMQHVSKNSVSTFVD
jgi:hypothetical protein